MQQHLVTTVTITRNIMKLYIKQRYGKNATTPNNTRYKYQEHCEDPRTKRGGKEGTQNILLPHQMPSWFSKLPAHVRDKMMASAASKGILKRGGGKKGGGDWPILN